MPTINEILNGVTPRRVVRIAIEFEDGEIVTLRQPIEAGGRYVPTNMGGAVSVDGLFAETRLEWLPLADEG